MTADVIRLADHRPTAFPTPRHTAKCDCAACDVAAIGQRVEAIRTTVASDLLVPGFVIADDLDAILTQLRALFGTDCALDTGGH